MNRLTKHYNCKTANKILEALGTDHHLSAEEVQIVNCENELCTETCERVDNCEECPINEAIKKLADYEDAEEQGLLHIFPVSIGSYVYLIDKFFYSIYRCEIIELHVGEYTSGFSLFCPKLGIIKLQIDRIGNDIFLTEEEAEAALKKM